MGAGERKRPRVLWWPRCSDLPKDCHGRPSPDCPDAWTDAGPKRRKPARSIAALLVAYGLEFATQSAILVLAQLHIKHLGGSPSLIAMATALTGLGLFMGSYFWGWVSDRCRRRPLMLLGLGIDCLLVATLAARLSIPVILALLCLRALGFSSTLTISLSTVSSMGTAQNRGRLIARLSTARAIGWIAGSLCAGIALDEVGYSYTYLILAVAPFIAFMTVFLRGRSFESHGRSRPTPTGPKSLRHLADLLAATCLRQIGLSGASSLLFAHLALLGMTASEIGLLGALNPVFQFAGFYLLGRLADSIGRRVLLLVGFGCSVLPPLLYALARNAPGLGLACAIHGASFSVMYIGTAAYIGDSVSTNVHGRALGGLESARAMGAILGPVCAGLIASLTSYAVSFLSMAAFTAMGFLVSVLTSLRRGKASLGPDGSRTLGYENGRERRPE